MPCCGRMHIAWHVIAAKADEDGLGGEVIDMHGTLYSFRRQGTARYQCAPQNTCDVRRANMNHQATYGHSR